MAKYEVERPSNAAATKQPQLAHDSHRRLSQIAPSVEADFRDSPVDKAPKQPNANISLFCQPAAIPPARGDWEGEMDKGSVTASCGHKLADDENCVPVVYESETCDAVDGFIPCTVYADFCPACAAKWKANGWLTMNPQPPGDA